jgi:hypothetical protein
VVLGGWAPSSGGGATRGRVEPAGLVRKKLAVEQYSTENGPVRLAELRFTKLDAKRQNRKETTRRTRWCAHLRPRMNDGSGGVAGVGEESPELGKTTESTSDSRDRPHHV